MSSGSFSLFRIETGNTLYPNNQTLTPSSGVAIGSFLDYTSDPSANGTSLVGVAIRGNTLSSDASNYSQVTGLQEIGRHLGSGLVGELFGTLHDAVVGGAGNATWAYSAVYRTFVQSTGSIATGSIGAYFPVPSITGAGTIANHYTIYIDDIDGISTGNEYVFFYNNGTDGIYMQGDGKVGIGVEFPSVEMDINGQLKTTGLMTIGTGQSTLNGNLHVGSSTGDAAIALKVTGATGVGSGGIGAIKVIAGAHTNNANTSFTDFFLDGDRTVNFVGGGASFDITTFKINPPTFTADAAQTLGIVPTVHINGAPGGSTNITIENQVGLLVGNLSSEAGNSGDFNAGIVAPIPGIANGTGSVDTRAGIVYTNRTLALGNTTSTLSSLASISFNNIDVSSDTLTRTVTKAAHILISGDIASTGNVTFTNPPYSIWVESTANQARFDVIVQGLAGMRTKQSVANFSAPPTDAELDAEFGTPATLGRGFFATIDDNDADTDSYFVWTTDGSWYVATGTKAL